MTLKLETLATSDLTNLKVGQLINRHLSDLDTIDPVLRTDAPFSSYFSYQYFKSKIAYILHLLKCPIIFK